MTDDFPSVKVTTDDTSSVDRGPVAYHLDDAEGPAGITEMQPVYVYVWEDEIVDRRDELAATIEDLRSAYVFAHGIEYVEALRPHVPLSEDELSAYVWLMGMGLWSSGIDSDEARQVLYGDLDITDNMGEGE
jgi:hypothetical protein